MFIKDTKTATLNAITTLTLKLRRNIKIHLYTMIEHTFLKKNKRQIGEYLIYVYDKITKRCDVMMDNGKYYVSLDDLNDVFGKEFEFINKDFKVIDWNK